MLTDIRALADHFLIALPNINSNILLQRDFLQPLATNTILLQNLLCATKLGLLQCFLVVVQGIKVSSVTSWVAASRLSPYGEKSRAFITQALAP